LLESSIIFCFFRNIVQAVLRYWEYSRIRAFFQYISRLFKRLCSGSAIVSFLSRDGFLARHWENSSAYRLLDRLFNGISGLLTRIYKRFQRLLEGSLIFRIVLFLSNYVHILTAVYLMILFMVPQNYWRNVFSLIAISGLLFLFLVNTVVNKDLRLYTKAIDVYLFLFILCIIIAQVFSVFPGLSLRFFVLHFLDFALVILLASSIRTREQLETVIEIILVGVAATGLYGMYQGIVGVPVIASQMDPLLNEGMPGRIFSTFENSNAYAQVIVMMAPFFVSVFLSAKGFKKKLIFLLAFLPLMLSLVMTLSRTGWLGFAVSVLVFLFLVRKSLILLLILLGILAYPFLPEFIQRRLASITNLQDSSTSTRFDIIKTMWPMIKDFWLTGLGLGHEAIQNITLRYTIYTKTVPLHFHNLYLQVWLETGILGILSFLGFIANLLKRALRVIYDKDEDPYLQNTLKAGIASICGALTISLAEHAWFYLRVMLIFWLVIGLMITALAIDRRQRQVKPAEKTEN
jgi:putative inorganic carbon (HCO3(-)) transporter